MQLTYRGISFTTLVAGIPSCETGETGTFLGKTYKIKQAQVVNRHNVNDLTYRGVHYSR